ncbi:TPA: hypothetical protein MPK85_003489 [Salmonella enterica]|nr:hypothetical protein [Salmonella enterica subsp. diarizonae]HCA3882833.1 hypothetical protein [Salmonella enterica]
MQHITKANCGSFKKITGSFARYIFGKMEVLPQLWKSDYSVPEVLPPDNGSFSASSGAAAVNSGSLTAWLVEKWKFYSESRGFMEV